jgi:hypothetical protein
VNVKEIEKRLKGLYEIADKHHSSPSQVAAELLDNLEIAPEEFDRFLNVPGDVKLFWFYAGVVSGKRRKPRGRLKPAEQQAKDDARLIEQMLPRLQSGISEEAAALQTSGIIEDGTAKAADRIRNRWRDLVKRVERAKKRAELVNTLEVCQNSSDQE